MKSTQYFVNKAKYSFYAKLANACTMLYLANTNNVLGDFFADNHKKFSFKAHSARMANKLEDAVFDEKELENRDMW